MNFTILIHHFSLFALLQRTCLALESCPPKKKRGYLFFLGKLLDIWRHSHLIQNKIVAIRQINGALLKLRKTDVCAVCWYKMMRTFPSWFLLQTVSGKALRTGFWGRNRRNVDLFVQNLISNFLRYPEEFTWMHSHLKVLTRIVYSTQDYLNQDLAYKSQI